MTHHDDQPTLASRAELIWMLRHAGLPPTALKDSPLWHLAAALGLHRIETYQQRDEREIVETKQEYWEQTGQERMERMARVATERKARALQRKREKAAR